MFKSKLFLKAMMIVTSVIILYTIAISFFTIPKIDNSILKIEEKNAKEILYKIVTLTKNVYVDLENYRKDALKEKKEDLKNLTDVAWSIINKKYEQSTPKKLESLLKKRGDNFKNNLIHYYNSNKNKMSKDELKLAIINYTNIYRSRDGIGYFWINDFKPTMIVHPIIKKLNGKYLGNYQDPNGIYLFNKMVERCTTNGSGIVNYQWLNPKNKIIEDKISYVFVFKPFNWIIGTGEYISELEDKLKKDTKKIVEKLRYGKDGYFWINDFNPTMIMHPFKKELNGQDLTKFKDPNGKYPFNEMVNICKKDDQGYVKYYWPKPNYKNPQPKISYVKSYKKWNWIIGTGIYTDNIDKTIQIKKEKLLTRLRDIIRNTHIGTSGYLYIFNSKGDVLIHPNSGLEGKNFSKLRNPQKGTYIFDDLIKASKTPTKELLYKWDKPSDQKNYIYNKISWVEYIPEFDWYIGSSAYIDEFKESANELRTSIYTLAIIILIIALLSSFFFFKHLLLPISKLSDLILKVTKGDYSVRSNIKRDDEIGILSDEFNKMIITTQSVLDDLSNNVEKLKNSESKMQLLNDSLENKIKEAVEKNSEQQKQIFESAKMVQMGEMIGNIAHQWRQPLSAIATGATGMIVQKEYNILDDKSFIHTCESINTNAQYLSKTIDDFKNFIKGDRSKSIFLINDNINSFLNLVEGTIKTHHINIILDLENNIEIYSYDNELIQCLINIFNNAKDAMKDMEEQDKYIFIYTTKSNNQLLITIKDSAGGIPKDVLPKIFEPYFTTKHKSQGTGLGLHMTYNLIVNGMKGTITAKNTKYTYNSIEYKGAEFTITLPLK